MFAMREGGRQFQMAQKEMKKQVKLIYYPYYPEVQTVFTRYPFRPHGYPKLLKFYYMNLFVTFSFYLSIWTCFFGSRNLHDYPYGLHSVLLHGYIFQFYLIRFTWLLKDFFSQLDYL